MTTEKTLERDAQTVTANSLKDLPPKETQPEEGEKVNGGAGSPIILAKTERKAGEVDANLIIVVC